MNTQTMRRENSVLQEDARRPESTVQRQQQSMAASPQKSAKPKKANMPKAQALALTQKLKHGLVVASVLCFGSLGGFLLGHSTITTAATTTSTQTVTSQATPTSTSKASSTSTSQTSNATSTSSTSSSSSQQGGSNFGSTSTSQAPVSGSSVS